MVNLDDLWNDSAINWFENLKVLMFKVLKFLWC